MKSSTIDYGVIRVKMPQDVSGDGFCFRAQSRSHLIAAARVANRCPKRKSSRRFKRSGSITKFRYGLSDAGILPFWHFEYIGLRFKIRGSNVIVSPKDLDHPFVLVDPAPVGILRQAGESDWDNPQPIREAVKHEPALSSH